MPITLRTTLLVGSGNAMSDPLKANSERQIAAGQDATRAKPTLKDLLLAPEARAKTLTPHAASPSGDPGHRSGHATGTMRRSAWPAAGVPAMLRAAKNNESGEAGGDIMAGLTRLGLAIALGAAWAAAAQAQTGTLDRVRDSGAIVLGYREDAVPFSFADETGVPAGYSVALCDRIAAAVGDSLGLDDLAVEYVPVTAETRFTVLEEGGIDLLCGATTVTLDRRARMDFSLLTFATGTGVLTRDDTGIETFEDMAGRRVGVLAGTTTAEVLDRSLAGTGIEAEVVTLDSHDAGLAALEEGDIDAWFGDRVLLLGLGEGSAQRDRLVLSQGFLSYEPYALALRRGDDDLRLIADRTLAQLYRSGEIVAIYRDSFGTLPPSELLRALYVLHALPE
jgi:ABC-type amino acid transport substrate-binding protein